MADSLWHEREAEFVNDDFGRSTGARDWLVSLGRRTTHTRQTEATR